MSESSVAVNPASSTPKNETRTVTSDAASLAHPDQFVSRHIGPGSEDARQMLGVCGFNSLDEMIAAAVPAQIRLSRPLQLPPAKSEYGPQWMNMPNFA